MHLTTIDLAYKKYKEHALFHRYITANHIAPLLEELSLKFEINEIGKSVNNLPINSIQIGTGSKRILLWSQMHGNESTTTKALFDLINTFCNNDKKVYSIFSNCTLCIIPILNPDGALAYTRLNANGIDLNRDAQDLTQPESKLLREVFNTFKPNFCFNLHGQRTIFSAGDTNHSATVSFLAPAQDKNCTLTNNRKVAMEVIGKMYTLLQNEIPDQVGVYDDAFNINCVGDTFQSMHVPTILFEAGHFSDDYKREYTRELIYKSYMISLNYIAENDIDGSQYKPYLTIPENKKCFFDIIIRNALVSIDSKNIITDIGVMYIEKLINNTIEFIPKIEKISKLSKFFGHKEIDASGHKVLNVDFDDLKVGYENDFVLINNVKYSLKIK
jgi:hypothetical protein